jgi:hypothetical protein
MAGLFDNLFGAPGGMYADMLSPEQQAAIRRQSMMQMAAKLLQSSGPSPVRQSFGQIAGGALAAGADAVQAGQTNAVQQMLLKQKLDEAKLTAKQREDFTAMLTGLGTDATTQPAAPLTPFQALLAPAGGRTGPTPQNAAMIGQRMPAPAPVAGSMPASSPAAQQSVFQMLSPQQRQLIAAQGPVEGSKTLLNMTQEAMKFGAPTAESRGGRPVLVSRNSFGQERIVEGSQPYEAQSPDIRAVEYISGRPLAGTGTEGISQVGQYRQQIAPRTNVTVPVDMTGGQKGFENEMKLGSAFKGEPIYKEFNDMKSAFGQVVSSLSQGTPIGDVAGATKIMKLLDPGSVVRESELGIAMAAAGRLDRLQNYFNNMISGQILTPTQREDFKKLSTELYAAAADGYNKKRGEYEQFGQSYGFKNLGTALGPAADVPSIMRPPAAGGAARPPLSNIFGSPQ